MLYLEDGHVVDKSYMQNPFAANVNDILRQNFFLKNGFMGEFAKQKILKAIDDYNKKKLDSDEANELVNLIGEPLLKDRLSEVIKEEI